MQPGCTVRFAGLGGLDMTVEMTMLLAHERLQGLLQQLRGALR